jgi:hypothetical protein
MAFVTAVELCAWADVEVRATVDVDGVAVDLPGSPSSVSVFRQGVSCGPFLSLVSVEPAAGGGSRVVADGSDSWTVVMGLVDYLGNPVEGGAAGVGVQVLGADGEVTGLVVVSPVVELGGGRYSLSLASVVAGSYTLRYVSGDEVLTGQEVTFEPVPVPPGTPSVSVSEPGDGVTITTGTPVVSGVSEPGNQVRVLLDDAELCVATAGIDGVWTCAVVFPLADGQHTLAVVATDASGNASAPATTTFQVEIAGAGGSGGGGGVTVNAGGLLVQQSASWQWGAALALLAACAGIAVLAAFRRRDKQASVS